MTVQVRYTSYGASALSALAEVVGQAKQQDPMAPVTLLVPNNIAGLVARRNLAEHGVNGRPGIAGIYLATLPRLPEQVAAAQLHPRRPGTSPVLASAWRAALDRQPGVFAGVKDHPATIRALVAAHRELRDLSDDGLDDVAARTSLAADVVRLHRAVVTSLAPDWYDATDLLRLAPAYATERRDELGQVVLYLPQRLTAAEVALARALAEDRELTVIAGLTNVERADRVVHESLARLGVTRTSTSIGIPTASSVVHASDSDDEVRTIVRNILRTLQHTPAHRVAVLYADRVPYARLIHEQLAAAGITVNGPGVRPVDERALSRGFLAVLALAGTILHRSAVFDALAEAPTRAFGDDHVPVSRWERLSRLAGVVEGRDWARRLETYTGDAERAIAVEQESEDPSEARIDGLRRDTEDALALRDFVAALQRQLEVGGLLRTWDDLSGWALHLFHDLYGDPVSLRRLPPEEQYAAAVIETSLNSLPTLGALESTATLDRLREVLALDVESALPTVGRFGTGVFVGPMSSSIGLSADKTFVLGLAEDLYPGRLHQDALLPETVRAGSELAGTREALDAKQQHLLAAIASAPDVTASFPRGDLRKSTQRLPSQFLLGTLRELTGDKRLPASRWQDVVCGTITGSDSFAAGLTTAILPATEQEWRTRALAARLPVVDEAVEAARRMLVARANDEFTHYDGNLAGAADLPDPAATRRPISPTALESYADCPFAYFIRRMLRVEPLVTPEELVTISPIDLGTLIHETLDDFIKAEGPDLPGYGERWTLTQRQRLLELGSAKAREFEARGLTGHAVLWEQQRLALLGDLARILDEDDDFRTERQARVLGSELSFGDGVTDPVAIAVPTGEVLMRGSADLVHETTEGMLIVTDVKTGGSSRFQAVRSDAIDAGTRLQLPVYAHAARAAYGGTVAEAAYCFVRSGKSNDRIAIVLDEALEDRYADAIGALATSIASGAFPARAPDGPDFFWVQCPYCNADGIGHGEVRERWERKRHDPTLAALVQLVEPGALHVEVSP